MKRTEQSRPNSRATCVKSLTASCMAIGLILSSSSAFATSRYAGQEIADSQYSTKAIALINSCTTSEISGFATLKERQSDEGIKEVEVFIQMNGLGNGQRAVHLHETASCTPCSSAGGHFDPGTQGLPNPDANHPYHSGDLPQITSRNNVAVSESVSSRITLSSGPLSLLDSDGSAVIVHDNPDSYCPFGEVAGCAGGSRAACGIVTQVAVSDDFELFVSNISSRRHASELSNRELGRKAYVFLTPLSPQESVTSVNFFINGRPIRTETSPPYDLTGTLRDGRANSLDTRFLANGTNTVSAIINLSSGEQTFVSSVFTVDNKSIKYTYGYSYYR